MSPIDLPKIYNPQTQSKQELINNFVVRMGIFQDIFEEIKSSKMKHPEQHYIIQGIRGQGKTTLLLRIAYEIEKDKVLNKKLIPIVFNEEQYKVRKLYKLWEETAMHLQNHVGFENLYDKILKIEFDDEFEEKCFQLLEKTLQKNKKKLIFFIDNIGDMLNKFTLNEHHRLREILIESAEIRIIGASSVSLEFHHDYNKPFYKFFRMPVLRGLNQKETKTLLLSLGKKYKRERVKNIVQNDSGRIEALRRVTGGVIRTIVILYQIFVDDENGNAFLDLEKILDEVTPLYKHRMDNLSAQQQEIVDIIALNWDAISTKDLALKTREKSKAISAQLKTLTLNQVIEKQGTNTKNYLYRLSERFFNIWYLMRHGSKNEENKVKWLVEFLQCWCDKTELEQRAQKHLKALQKGNLIGKHALYMTEALSRTGKLDREFQHHLITVTKEYLIKAFPGLSKELSKSDKELDYEAFEALYNSNLKKMVYYIEQIKNKTQVDLNHLGEGYLHLKQFGKAEKIFNSNARQGDSTAMFYLAQLYRINYRDFQKAEKYLLMAIKNGDTRSIINLAYFYEKELKNYKKATEYYKIAINNKSTKAMNMLGLLYENKLEDFDNAKKYYSMAIAENDAEAMNNLALLYQLRLKKYIEAEKYYLEAIKNNYSIASFNLAQFYRIEFEEPEKAMKYYLNAIEENYPQAYMGLALLYEEYYKNYKKAEKYYIKATNNKVKDAFVNLAVLYHKKIKDYIKAEQFYLKAIRKKDTLAMYNLALLYNVELKDYRKAEKYYLKAVSNKYVSAMYNLAKLYNNDLNDIKKAEKYYLMSAENGQMNAMNDLAWLYFSENINKQKALNYAEKQYNTKKNIFIAHTYSTILLWNNEIEQALEISKDFMENKDTYEKFPKDIRQFLMLLIAKKQFHSVLKIFNENSFQLKDRFKPVYYALMYFMQKEYPNEYIKMGSELKQTVEEIIEEINEMAEKYK